VRRLEDAGAPMIVMHSLFEEQIAAEEIALTRSMEMPKESYAEALSYFPEPEEFELGPDEYLEQVRRVKSAVAVPVIGSLNGVSAGGWTRYARLIEQAGANGLEINLYEVAADLGKPGDRVEQQLLDVVLSVRKAVSIPLAVKLSPFFSSLGNFIYQIDNCGVDGFVLFNRFYQPDLDIENLDLMRSVGLSNSSELLLRLRWLAILFGRVTASMAASGGVHTAIDAIKAIMAGANACQMVSALLRRGPTHLKAVLEELTRWLEEHEYDSLAQMQGSLSLQRVPNPGAYERANYAKILQTWEEQTL
jgi:dihydroorotate dehydrogenase (fumarate)